jgi:MFS family permease
MKEHVMAEQETETLAGLIRSVLDDTRELIREEIALARAEVREEVREAQTVGIAFGAAAVVALIAAAVLSIAIGGAIAYILQWPAWAGYAIISVVMLLGAYLLVRFGRRRLANLRALPTTKATIKENLEWMQSKSASR